MKVFNTDNILTTLDALQKAKTYLLKGYNRCDAVLAVTEEFSLSKKQADDVEDTLQRQGVFKEIQE